ncbi:MAG: hypothetical protein HQ538_01830 [Parcubacteria group bacterium]|nr:hypothetical protein [Parcubacteria group bacterium]
MKKRDKKSWKEWSYWLKGGIVGGIIWLIYTIYRYLLEPPLFSSFGFYFDRAGNLIFLVLIGFLIGWIYGKIKSQKN